MGNTHPERGVFWGSNFLVEVRPGKYSFRREMHSGKYSSGERCILGE